MCSFFHLAPNFKDLEVLLVKHLFYQLFMVESDMSMKTPIARQVYAGLVLELLLSC